MQGKRRYGVLPNFEICRRELGGLKVELKRMRAQFLLCLLPIKITAKIKKISQKNHKNPMEKTCDFKITQIMDASLKSDLPLEENHVELSLYPSL